MPGRQAEHAAARLRRQLVCPRARLEHEGLPLAVDVEHWHLRMKHPCLAEPSRDAEPAHRVWIAHVRMDASRLDRAAQHARAKAGHAIAECAADAPGGV